MAGSTGGVSLSLSRVLSEKYNGRAFRKYAQNQLLDKADDMLIAWSKEDSCIFAQLIDPPDSKVQTLALSKPPVWEVERILLNHNGRCVALIGRRGVAVVELPSRHGELSLYDGGRDVITCRVEYIAERFFLCHPKLEVVSASWHPGSLDHNYIALLASDSYLRIYNLSSHEIPEQAILVAPNTNVLNTSSYARSANLGESAVDFGFALPSEQTKRVCGNPVSSRLREDAIDSDEEMKQKYLDLQWPVFILYGNGDVYFTNTILGPNRPPFHSVYGPLTMSPASEDNYGVDCCSLLVLQSSPPVLIIATSTGQLLHCVVIDSDEEDEDDQKTALHNGSRIGLATSVKLHVYERVDLELSLLPDDEDFSCPLLLCADPTSPIRYWVCHEAGVHGVTFPLVGHLLRQVEVAEDVMFLTSESQCIVDHVVCTRSLSPAAPMPVIGLVITTFNVLYVLLASGVIITYAHPPAFFPQSLDIEAPEMSSTVSPLKKVHTESFEDHIRNVLHRLSSQPILASGSNAAVTAHEYLNLINRVMQTLRLNYLKPQNAARDDIQKRAEVLIEQKQRLQAEIATLQLSKKELTARAHELAERYEEANDRKSQLISRFERVVTQIMRGLPGLSTAEKNMMQELEGMQKHTSTLSNQLTLIEEKAKFQTSQMEKLNNNESSKHRQMSSLSDSQMKALIQALGKEGEKISVLVDRVNEVKHDLRL